MDGLPPRHTKPPRRRALHLFMRSVLLLGMAGRGELSAQRASALGPTPDPAVSADESPHLSWDTPTEAWLLSYAVKFGVTTEMVTEPTRRLPLSGLDPRDIRWSLDRGFAGTSNLGAGRASSHIRNAAVLFPFALSAVLARPSARWRDMAVSGAVYGEALLITSAVTQLGKAVIGRPRPGAYLPQPAPTVSEGLDPTGPGIFHSMPSSHASIAWTGTSVALTSHLLLRPKARWGERVALGFVGGALAGATSALRVRAGAHFPSDVVVGAGIGITSGVLVPLAHRGDRPLPSGEAWLQTIAGTAAGTVVGVLLSSH
jgi:membrane-associated phospholipid phosphatase